MISRPDLAKVIAEKTMHMANQNDVVQTVAAYLLDEGRTEDVSSLMRDVARIRNEHGLVEATVVSAYELDSGAMNEVKGALKLEYPNAKSFVINKQIDPTLVGGLRIEMAGEELDLSVRAKLNTLKRLTAARSI
jgi:F0F1-type ATP synthase delta subunit